MTLPTSEALRERPIERPVEPPRPPAIPKRRKAPLIPQLVVADEAQEMDVWRRHWETIYGFLCSLGVHTVLLIVLAFLVFDTSSREVGNGLLGVFGQPNGNASSDFTFDSELNTNPGGSEQPLEIASSSLHFNESGLLSGGAAVKAGGGGTGTGEGEGDGSGAGIGVPGGVGVPGYAVTKGSFSAWTEPRDPDPGMVYHIIIQVRLPKRLQQGKAYPVKDITGMVTGTDGYKKVIRFKPTDKVDVQDGVIQFQVEIPGAAQLVRDTIRIESKLLKEKQTIELVF